MKYSTTKAIVNKIRPGTFRNGYRGVGALGRAFGDTTGVSLSSDMMLGIAIGALGIVAYCKTHHKLRSA